VGIGPVVFYPGFTRSFLEGEQGTSQSLIASAVEAVQRLSMGKKVVLVDGVGYPAVGSICGISNADIAAALHAPVLLVGKKGVGDAVDSFNLNATFFEAKGVKVLGALFNRLPTNPEDFYSLSKCRTAVTRYFTLSRPTQLPYGFVPLLPDLFVSDLPNPAAEIDPTSTANMQRTAHLDEASWRPLGAALFEHVDIKRLLSDARRHCLFQAPLTMRNVPSVSEEQISSHRSVTTASRVVDAKEICVFEETPHHTQSATAFSSGLIENYAVKDLPPQSPFTHLRGANQTTKAREDVEGAALMSGAPSL
jgi:hypothetical protein